MKTKYSIFLLSVLSAVALTSLANAGSSIFEDYNSFEDKNVSSYPTKKKIAHMGKQSLQKENLVRPWLNQSQVHSLIAALREKSPPPQSEEETSDVESDSEFSSSGSIILIPSPSQSRSQRDLDTSVGRGASYTGPLTPQQRQVEFAEKSAGDLVAGNLSAVFAVLNRSDIENHPVFSNGALHHLYEAGFADAVYEMRRKAHPDKHTRKTLDSGMWKNISSHNVPSTQSNDQADEGSSVVRKVKRVFNNLKTILYKGLS